MRGVRDGDSTQGSAWETRCGQDMQRHERLHERFGEGMQQCKEA